MIKPNFEFQEQFGRIFHLIPDAHLAFETLNGELYSIPENISEEELENLMSLSPREWRGGARHCSRVLVGEPGLETC